MKRAAFLTATLLISLSTLPAEPRPTEPQLLLLPLVVATPQKSSPRMTALVARFTSENLLSQLKQTMSIPLLPEWVYKEKETEVFFMTPETSMMHGRRYAIVLRGDGSVLVVRAGGLSDVYEYFALSKSV